MREIVFDRSIGLIQNVILSHARDSLHALVARIDRLRELVPAAPVGNGIFIHPEIPSVLSDIAFHQGAASMILFNDNPKGARENAETYRLRLDRIAYVQAKCAGIAMAVLSDRKIRNSLTHIDEHLPRALSKPNTGWFIDIAATVREPMGPQQHGLAVGFCRTYIASEDIILHLDGEISVSDLKADSQAVLHAVWGEERPAPQ
jgi:hypothetical protein